MGRDYGVRTFVPIMLEQNTECHIVNTASILGLISGSTVGIYKVTKHGVVSLSETLACELADINSKIKVSVLCPANVNTRIMDSGRNRPLEFQNDSTIESINPKIADTEETLHQLLKPECLRSKSPKLFRPPSSRTLLSSPAQRLETVCAKTNGKYSRRTKSR